MSASTAKLVEALDAERVRVSGDATLEEVHEAVPDRELYVEPLSTSQPLAEFLAEGGVGFGSLRNGTFGGQLCQVKAAYSENGRKTKFSYGLGGAALYNVGYPLQRIMEGPRSELLGGSFAKAATMILRTRKKVGVSLKHSPAETPELPRDGGFDEAFFVNAAAARAMGFPGAGVVEAKASDQNTNDAWSRRFLLDALPDEHEKLLVVTQQSGARKLHEAHGAKAADGFFLALAVHLGVLVAISAPAAGVEEIAKVAEALPLTWRLGA
jgi:hypothetical protein